MRAWVQASFINRSWDTGPKRAEDAQAFANRAVAITPEAVDALYALSIVRLNQAAYAESESFARRAMAANPDDGYIRRALSQAVRRLGRGEEAEEILKEALRLNPRDALTHYNLGSLYANIAGSTASPERLAVGLKHFDAALAVEPFASALVQKAGLVAAWKGDLMSMRAALNQLEKMSSAERAEARDLIAPVELAARDLPNLNGWLGKYYAACGDAPNATRLVRTRIDRATFFTRHCLRLDPWWDKLRGQPDFEALLAEPKAQPARETKK